MAQTQKVALPDGATIAEMQNGIARSFAEAYDIVVKSTATCRSAVHLFLKNFEDCCEKVSKRVRAGMHSHMIGASDAPIDQRTNEVRKVPTDQ